MALLTDEEKKEVAAEFAKKVFKKNVTADQNIDDLVAAVTVIDTFLNTNQASLNNSLPEPFKTRATVSQKSLLLGLTADKRANG